MHILLSSKFSCRLVRADCTFFLRICLFVLKYRNNAGLVTERFWYSFIPKDTNQSLTYIPNQFLSVHWSRWENSKQRIFSRLKKVYPTTSDMLSWARFRQLWNLSTDPQIQAEHRVKTLLKVISHFTLTCCHSHSETWWRCCCWRRQTASERTGWCICTGRVPGNICPSLQKLLQESSRIKYGWTTALVQQSDPSLVPVWWSNYVVSTSTSCLLTKSKEGLKLNNEDVLIYDGLKVPCYTNFQILTFYSRLQWGSLGWFII